MRYEARRIPAPEHELARLNATLRAGCSFDLRAFGANGHMAVRARAPCPAATRGDVPRSIGGVLVSVEAGVARESAVFPVALWGSRRGLLMSLAHCFAECAMDLGMGTGIYRQRRDE